jgi:hypothetical protein
MMWPQSPFWSYNSVELEDLHNTTVLLLISSLSYIDSIAPYPYIASQSESDAFDREIVVL